MDKLSSGSIHLNIFFCKAEVNNFILQYISSSKHSETGISYILIKNIKKFIVVFIECFSDYKEHMSASNILVKRYICFNLMDF